MRKLSKDILERAIKTGMRSEGYSGKTIDRRAIEALRGAKLGKLLGKKEVEQKQIFAALEALKKKGLISEKANPKFLLKKSVEAEKEQKKAETVLNKRAEEARERLHKETAKGYLYERQKEEGLDYDAIRKSIGKEGEGEARIQFKKEEPKEEGGGWVRKQEKPVAPNSSPEPPQEPKDLPI